MPSLRPLTAQALNDILLGSTFLGAGGGGPFQIGKQIVDRLLQGKSPVQLADPRSVPDSARLAVSAVAGSPLASLTNFDFNAATDAFRYLDGVQAAGGNPRFAGVLPGEIGAGNTLVPLLVGQQTGLPVIDAAGARRAIPLFSMCTYASNQVPIAPIGLAGGDTQMTLEVASAEAGQQVVDDIIGSGAFPGYVGMAFWMMSGATMKQVALRDTTTYAEGIGRVIRQSKGRNTAAAVCAAVGGRVCFQGSVKEVHEHTGGGFDLGSVVLQAPDGSEAWIYNQNENLIAYSTESAVPLAMAPDLICYLTADGQPFSNAELPAIGTEVVVIAAPAPAEMKTPALLQTFLGLLRTLGYGGPYVPVSPTGGATASRRSKSSPRLPRRRSGS